MLVNCYSCYCNFYLFYGFLFYFVRSPGSSVMSVLLDERGNTSSPRVCVFSRQILDLLYMCVFSVFAFCVVVFLFPGVEFRVCACVGLIDGSYFKLILCFSSRLLGAVCSAM